MNEGSYLAGQLLLALPGIGDPRFEQAVIYMCQHSAEGAMGIIINKRFQSLTLGDLLKQLDVETVSLAGDGGSVLAGGPVEPGRGFVLHSDDVMLESSARVASGIVLTHTVDILRAIGSGEGPKRALVALGYAGWAPGQLDNELTRHGWLTADASDDIVFNADLDVKWRRAMASLGIDSRLLATESGHA